MAAVGKSFIEFDADLTQALAKITQLERRANEAKQALAAPVSIGAGGADAATLSFKEMEAELAKVGTGLDEAKVKTNEQAIAESKLAAALGDHARAIELLEAQIAKENAETVEGIRLSTQITQLENQQTAAIRRQADERVRIAASEARALAVKKDYAGALGIVRATQEEETAASAGALSQLTSQAAQYEVAGTAAGAFGAHLGALLNPVTLVIGGIAAATKVVSSFGDALHNQGQLEEERTSFGGIIGDFQHGNTVLDEAIKRNREYGFTAKQTTDAFKELAPVIRDSTSSTADQAGALERISVLRPDDPVNALKSAIEGIRKGRFSEIAGEMGLTKTQAKTLADQVAQGKDVFVALNDALDSHGITLNVARDRMDGYAGAEKRAQQAGEDLQKAQAKFGQGPGAAAVNAWTAFLNNITDAFNSVGEVKTAEPASKGADPAQLAGAVATEAELAAATDKVAVANDRLKDDTVQLTGALDNSKKALDAELGAKIEAEEHTGKFAELQQQLDVDTRLAAEGLLGAGDQALILAAKYGIAADAAQFLIDKQRGVAAGIGALIDAQTKATTVLTQPGGIGIGAPGITSGANNSIDAVVALQAANKAADDARTADLLKNGTATQIVTERQKELNQAIREHGATSAEAITAQTTLTDAQHAATSASHQALDDQIALAKATGDTVTARRLLNQELSSAKATGDIGAQAKALEALKALDKAGRTAGGGKGISALDKSELTLIADKQARLDEVNRILEHGNLTQLQRNQYLIEQRKLQDDINDAVSKQRDLETDIALAQTHDAQDDLKAKREAAGLQRALDKGRLSADQQEAARLRLSELSLENSKRENEISDKQGQEAKLNRDFGKALDTSRGGSTSPSAPLDTSKGGGITPRAGVPTQALPLPSVAGLSPVTVNLAITIDGQTGQITRSNVDAGTILNLIGSGVNFRNLSGGTP